VERIDTLAFTVYFAVPALLLFEMSSELFRFASGVQTHGVLFGLIFLASFMISGVNLFAAIRFYRKDMNFLYSVWHSFAVNVYVWLHWIPCIVIALCQIMFRKQASTWHRTEHVGLSK
jgi:hypothetical protein